MGNRKQIVIRFSPEIYVVKGVIDRSVNKLYTLATQDGDSILNPNEKTRVFQRNDLLKVPTNTPKTAFTLKKVNLTPRLAEKNSHPLLSPRLARAVLLPPNAGFTFLPA